MCIALVGRNNFLKSWCNYGTYLPASCETIAVLDISENADVSENICSSVRSNLTVSA